MICASGLMRAVRPRMARKACTVLAIEGAKRWPDDPVPDLSSLGMAKIYPARAG
jgi:hypothetical protein